MPKTDLVPPVSYQGGKVRLASVILEKIFNNGEFECHQFYDVCCGSGAITVELINLDIIPKDKIVMIDNGPWGLVWQKICSGNFNLDHFRAMLDSIPQDLHLVKDYMEHLASQPVDKGNAAEVFLMLQAASFEGKAIWIEEGAWKN